MALFSMDDIKKANEAVGEKYFASFNTGGRANPGFRSRFLAPILSTPYGAVFVESTRAGHQHRRLYTVNYIDERNGIVEELSGFQEYQSSTGAKARARREQKRLRDEQAQVYGEQVRFFLARNGFMGDVDLPVDVWEMAPYAVGVDVHHGQTPYGMGRGAVVRELLENEAPEEWNVQESSKTYQQYHPNSYRFTIELPEQ